MAEVTPIKKIPHPTDAGKYDLSEFVDGDTFPADMLPEYSADDMGLGNVDNTSDADKPVSTAQVLADTESKERANHTGTQLANTISDFSAAVNLLTADKASTSTTDSIQDAVNAINAVLSSDETSLNELQEIVDFIQLNRSDLDALGISSIAGLQAALDAKADKTHRHYPVHLVATVTERDALTAVENMRVRVMTDDSDYEYISSAWGAWAGTESEFFALSKAFGTAAAEDVLAHIPDQTEYEVKQ